MDDADIQRAADEAAVIAQRVKDQKQSHGTEGRYIKGLQRGGPDYEMISLPLPDITRQQWPQLKATMA